MSSSPDDYTRLVETLRRYCECSDVLGKCVRCKAAAALESLMARVELAADGLAVVERRRDDLKAQLSAAQARVEELLWSEEQRKMLCEVINEDDRKLAERDATIAELRQELEKTWKK